MASESVQPILVLLSDQPGGNPTEFMIRRAFIHHDLDWAFHTVEVHPDGLDDAVRGIRAMGFRGAHVSLPHKHAVLPLMDRVSETAELIGAANTILREDDALIGENLEGRGMQLVLQELHEPAQRLALILGTGRAARAAAIELARRGIGEILIAGRQLDRATNLADLLAERFEQTARALPWQDDLAVPEQVDLLVQATTVGRDDPDARVPLQLETLRPETIVADMTANPPETRLLEEAAGRGCPVLDGLSLYVEQSAEAIRLWTGVEPDRTVMREALEEFLEV